MNDLITPKHAMEADKLITWLMQNNYIYYLHKLAKEHKEEFKDTVTHDDIEDMAYDLIWDEVYSYNIWDDYIV